MIWCANDGYALWQHDLVAGLSMQVPRTHEARLGRMGMDPAQLDQILLVHVVESSSLVRRLTGIRRTDLLGNKEPRDEKRIINAGSAKKATHLYATFRVPGGEPDEVFLKVEGQK